MSLQMTIVVVDTTKFLKDRTPWHHGVNWHRDCLIPWWGFQGLRWANHLVVWCRDADPHKPNKNTSTVGNRWDLKKIKCWDTPIPIWRITWNICKLMALKCHGIGNQWCRLHQTTWVIERKNSHHKPSQSTSTSYIKGVRLAMTQFKITCTRVKHISYTYEQ